MQYKHGAATAPLETMSAGAGRIYVTVNKRDRINAITFYDKNGHKEREIHPHHDHGGLQPHTHVGYDDVGGRPARRLTRDERRVLNRVERLWKEFKG